MCLYKESFLFDSHISNEREKNSENYNGTKILSNQFVIRLAQSTPIPNRNIDPSKQLGGVAFGFDNREDFFTMIKCSIESATTESLEFIKENKFVSKLYGGCIVTIHRIFKINLILRHDENQSIIDSTDTS
jgi:hypothetical protein